jgi:lysophospholipase L1-like esterase
MALVTAAITMAGLAGAGVAPASAKPATSVSQAHAATRRNDKPRPLRGPLRLTVVPHFLAGQGRKHAAATANSAAPQPPQAQCPASGGDTSCGIVIYIGANGTQVLTDPAQGPYDGADDTLVGVLNASGSPVSSLALSSDQPIFEFDGDGICTYAPWDGSDGCDYGATGYEGPNTSYADITSDFLAGSVNFGTALRAGQSAFFSLEEPLTSATLQPPPNYSALGDSYSAANGTFNANLDSGCDRGTSAWPEVLASPANLPQLKLLPSAYLACSGATSSQIRASQVKALQTLASGSNPPGVITVTAGGDDLGFPTLMRTCILKSSDDCTTVLLNLLTYLIDSYTDFADQLAFLYADIQDAAPQAQLNVVGYPLLLAVPNYQNELTTEGNCSWMSALNQELVYEVEQKLNSALRYAAAEAGATFIPILSNLQGHEMCDDTPWIMPPGIWNGLFNAREIGHPPGEGQSAIAAAVAGQLNIYTQPSSASGSAATRATITRLAAAARSAARAGQRGTRVPAAGGPLTIGSSGVSAGTPGVPYLGFLQASGGTAPYTWSVTTGSLPPGLTLGPATGIISGTPTASGT